MWSFARATSAAGWPLAAVLLLGETSPLHARDEKPARSLEGIKAFHVIVETLGPAGPPDYAASQEALQADVEARLREAGIAVDKEAAAIVYANVASVCHGPTCALSVVLEVQQKVRLEKRGSGSVLTAPTWRRSVTGLIGRQPELIRQNLRDQVDQLVAAYRSVNPSR